MSARFVASSSVTSGVRKSGFSERWLLLVAFTILNHEFQSHSQNQVVCAMEKAVPKNDRIF